MGTRAFEADARDKRSPTMASDRKASIVRRPESLRNPADRLAPPAEIVVYSADAIYLGEDHRGGVPAAARQRAAGRAFAAAIENGLSVLCATSAAPAPAAHDVARHPDCGLRDTHSRVRPTHGRAVSESRRRT